jgi:hypothetical protein
MRPPGATAEDRARFEKQWVNNKEFLDIVTKNPTMAAAFADPEMMKIL